MLVRVPGLEPSATTYLGDAILSHQLTERIDHA